MLNRRQFVACASPLVAAPALSAQMMKAPARYASRLRMVADGPTTFNYVLFNPANPPSVPPLDDSAEIRVLTEFPWEHRDLLHNRVYVASVKDPSHGELFRVSDFIVSVEDIEISDTPVNTLGFFGKCVDAPVPSPFGDIVGLVFSLGCQFTEGPAANFQFIGGYAAGLHATFVPSATGELFIQRPWHSF